MLKNQTLINLFLISLFVIITTILVWLPHYLFLPNFWGLNFENGFNTIYRNYDGLEYIVIAKTFYDPILIAALPQSLPANYYAAHFPGYALLILIFAPIFGALKSMLFVSIVSTILSAWAFFFLVRDFKLTQHPLFLTLIFLILPARWIIVRSVGSSEPLFILLVILSLYFFMKFEAVQKIPFIFASAFFGALAQFTRPPGALLFIALGLYILFMAFNNLKKDSFKNVFLNLFKYMPLLLIPLTLLGIFYWYSIAYNDFWAYFHSGDNIHLVFPPYQVFNKGQFWVGEIWLEDVVYILILGFLASITLFKKQLLPLAFFTLTYLTASSLVAHRDISRYLLPIAPFAIIAFEKTLTSREFKIVLIIVAFALYLYTQNFLIQNVAPIPNPTYFD